MNVYPLEGYRPQRQAHIRYPSLIKCCGCIHLRTGAGFAGLLWAGLSMYFAVLSFQYKSPFYSYLLQAPLLVFGVANLILSCVGLGVLFAVYVNRWHAIRTASSAVFVSTFLVAGDAIANTILFIATKSSYIGWCISSSSGALDAGVNSALNGTQTIDSNSNNTISSSSPSSSSSTFGFQTVDYYNCNKTWENELKFGILSAIMLSTLYLYWAMCIYSYAVKKGHLFFQDMDMAQPFQPEIHPIYTPVHPQPIQPIQPMPPVPPNIIILNNQKPSKYSNKKTAALVDRESDSVPPRSKSALLVLPDEPTMYNKSPVWHSS